MTYRPRFVEDGDPLQDENRLFRGPRLTSDEETLDPAAVKKSPSNQALGPFRWGTEQRKTGYVLVEHLLLLTHPNKPLQYPGREARPSGSPVTSLRVHK